MPMSTHCSSEALRLHIVGKPVGKWDSVLEVCLTLAFWVVIDTVALLALLDDNTLLTLMSS